MKIQLIATTTFGLEAVAKREIQALGYEILKVEDGKITYMADERGIVRSNLWLRTPDRILMKIDEFKALEFEDLFQRVKGYPWEELIPIDGKFTVNGSSVKSKLSSVPACQSVVKKAIVERLKDFYAVDYFEETGAEYTVKVTLLKDRATITVDTTGVGLHKRGYRVVPVAAPMKETMAAALVMLSFWKPGRLLVDPCCGSGTIPIEAAMIGMNIAPGLGRTFASQEWEFIDKELWKEERKAAYEAIDYDADIRIKASDINPEALEAARENAEEAGVDDCIEFAVADIKDLEATEENGIIITNPPYGERIGEEEGIAQIYKKLRSFFKENEDWSLFMITTDETVEEKVMGREANRRRKLFNGRLKTCYYQFHGSKPKRND
ncbi:MAG: class I SAM-dependent RNA methyltransferase [Eubacterium sp.]|nr:class I SAM-dependent RNA methyltransferase [Eubacterium sp.]